MPPSRIVKTTKLAMKAAAKSKLFRKLGLSLDPENRAPAPLAEKSNNTAVLVIMLTQQFDD